MAEIVRRRLLISGRVQGVYFRDSTRRQAVAFGVSGWARNLLDGRVEVVLEGDRIAVQQIIDWCHEGPARAQVLAVEVAEEALEGESGFVIK